MYNLDERKTYKARNGYTIRTTINGSEQGGGQTVYTIRSVLVDPDGVEIYSRLADGWAAFSKVDARKTRTEQVRDCWENIPLLP